MGHAPLIPCTSRALLTPYLSHSHSHLSHSCTCACLLIIYSLTAACGVVERHYIVQYVYPISSYVRTVCMHVCACVPVQFGPLQEHTYVLHIHTYVYTYICTCMHACVYVCMYVCMHVCTYVYVCTYVCMYLKWTKLAEALKPRPLKVGILSMQHSVDSFRPCLTGV